MQRFRSAAILIVLAVAGLFWFVRAGDLEPPGLPASTMKTLVDVEPRVAVRNDFDTLTPVVISLPGSYYLAEDIFALPGAHGIEIQANHVTLDLNGFSVIGNTEVGSNSGIYANPPVGFLEGIVIRNGTVRDFWDHGIYLVFAKYSRIENVQVMHNGLDGTGDGIRADTARIKDAIVVDHPGDGITGAELLVTGCLSYDNNSGIVANVVTESYSSSNADDGYRTTVNGVIAHSAATGNGGDGIQATNSLVIGNATDGLNALNGTSAHNEVN